MSDQPRFTPVTVPAAFSGLPVVLVLLCLVLEGGALLGVLPAWAVAGNPYFGTLEMALMLGLLWNGWRIRAWTLATPGVGETGQSAATLTFASLAVCLLGDLVNRNYGGTFHAYDTVVRHSYLADSVWFFLPGYTLFIVAAWRACRDRVPLALRIATLVLGAASGAATFAAIVLPGVSDYVWLMTGTYSIVISLMLPVALWIALAFRRPGALVAAGAVLALVADALIGRFWLFGEGGYPVVAYVNFIVYFISQALLQRFPLLVAAAAERG